MAVSSLSLVRECSSSPTRLVDLGKAMVGLIDCSEWPIIVHCSNSAGAPNRPKWN
ncbi:hypothetical protein AG1IA_06278 [Rhizoctonia solani AG-1 IA]|uniref:Uncharacterized protein n=1 Tax=Thanatephorus cucumeris (strain AG1-IA) TaxID=983506 RepID=L8WNE3_THACA|nr:hypothetical protein AG1IA_06278 [Rhizoctonia solani AG-1 IA]